MKKSILMATGCAVLLCTSSMAHSAEGNYVSYNISGVFLNDSDITDSAQPGITYDMEYDTGWALGIAVGYDFGNNLRLDGAVSYQQNQLDQINEDNTSRALTGDASSLSFLINGYYDFTNRSRFTPFLSAGFGLARVDFAGEIKDDDTVFAYQAGAGVSYAINETFSLDLRYLYLGTDDPTFETTAIEYASHNVQAGLRIAY
ncbi:MAG: outer membrane beta-barrel protein [Desulfurivibrionaceae bacterium]|nr:outer membrane beta-barrel protein [Desulfurivibrionaceae bacterium]